MHSTMLQKALVAATIILGDALLCSAAGTPVIQRREITVPRPSERPVLEAYRSQGCFKSKGNLTHVDTPEDRMSSGECNDACKAAGFWVSGLHGPECTCGFAYPPKDSKTSDEACELYPCPQYDIEPCGNIDPDAYLVWNLGVNILNVGYYEPKTSSTPSASSPTTPPQDSESSSPTPTGSDGTSDGSSDDNTADDDKDEGSSTNVAAIAAGVSVGVVLILALIGGGFYFMRRRRNMEIEEEHRRNAAVNAFISGSKPPSTTGSISMSDARLDPMAHRRMSDGSIADNEDYSRKILRVTNA
jgi:cell wall integrity and stress response component